MDTGHPPSSFSAQAPQGSATSNHTNSAQEPRKEGSGTVIACPQWYMPENKNTCPSSVHSLGVSAAALLERSGAIPPGPSALTASGGPTGISTMRCSNVGPRQVPSPASCPARNALQTAPPRRRGNARATVDNRAPTAGMRENMASMKSTFSFASRPSILLEEPRGAGYIDGARLSPPSVDFKPPREMNGGAHGM